MYNYAANDCGTTNILIGDGGNAGSVSDGENLPRTCIVQDFH